MFQISNGTLERLVDPLDEIVTVSVHKYSVIRSSRINRCHGKGFCSLQINRFIFELKPTDTVFVPLINFPKVMSSDLPVRFTYREKVNSAPTKADKLIRNHNVLPSSSC